MAPRLTRRTFLKATGATAAVAAAGGLAMWALTEDGDDGPGGPSPFVIPTAGPMVNEEVEDYVAVAPRVMRSGQTEAVSLSLFKGGRAAASTVAVALLHDGQPVAETTKWVGGRGKVDVDVPQLAAGEYALRVSAKGFSDQTTLRVEDGTIVFVETDKPIYKPGQTVHIRVLALDALLRPVPGEAVVEVMDAQGIRIFRRTVGIDDYGMGTVDLPLSSEPNMGVWSVQATLGERSARVDVRVERYVLPKYEVRVELERAWALVDEAIRGIVAAEYAFGKPVSGEVEIVAQRYVGVWEEYARITQEIVDGRMAFEVPPAGYVAGTPMGGGQGNVQLDVTVREQATGYEETTSELLAIAAGPLVLRVIPESNYFKPTLPLSLLLVAETPAGEPADADVTVNLNWQDEDYGLVDHDSERVDIRDGLATMRLTPPEGAVTLMLDASDGKSAWTSLLLNAGYSPSGAFIHVEQADRGPFAVGDTARFNVVATREGGSLFYEVLARGKVVYTDVSNEPEIAVTLTPLMAPEARLLVYQIHPNSEVAADYLPFSVSGDYPQTVALEVAEEVKPGDAVEIAVQTEGEARVGLTAVDRSVFILAENRLNLQQVFAELERLYQQPQAELHEVEGEVMGGWMDPYGPRTLPGAAELFAEAGVVVLTNRRVPAGKELESMIVMEAAGGVAPAAAQPTAASAAVGDDDAARQAADGEQAQVQRVRQFFPETWVWTDLTTDGDGRATQSLTAPDSITTWMFRAVALSKERGLGIGEAELRVFQEFFVSLDLPFAAIRGEEVPGAVALYNYSQSVEEITVELTPDDWFELLDDAVKTVTVEPGNVGAVSFQIRPIALGVQQLQVTARGQRVADAIIKELLVEPEGVPREEVSNLVLTPGAQTLELAVPPDAIDGSARAFVALTGNVLSQTIDGLEGLLQMSFGCGEQNMILFAPNVFVTRYLDETGQLKPEVRARAELLMLTGYQREMTYRRSDGSFSAFGESDESGSLWLTAFVLKTFGQARDLIYIDEAVLAGAAEWIRGHGNPDGSYDPVGFVHHQELLGGMEGRTALTAFVAIAMNEAGEEATAADAVRYLEGRLDATEDVYSLAVLAYALGLAGSGQAVAAVDKLMGLAQQDEHGIFWGDEPVPLPAGAMPFDMGRSSAAIETTGYAALALLAVDDPITAASALRWLAAQRNALGGFGSTQDTIVALQAMAEAASSSRDSVDATVVVGTGDLFQEVRVAGESADVVQVLQIAPAGTLTLETSGTGQVMAQVVRRYNLPEATGAELSVFKLDVDYGTESVAVDDRITITATIRYTPPEPLAAGMTVLDVAVPTGFAVVAETVDALLAGEPKLKRWEQAGRKVIFYIEDLLPEEELTLSFEAQALYPVRAEAVASRVYAYYRPEWTGESLGGRLTVA